MERLYILPKWFLSYGLGLELLFALVTLVVAIYTFKVYRLSKQSQLKYLSLGFLSIFLSYSIWFLLNFFALAELTENLKVLEIGHAITFINLGAFTHISLFLIGLILISYATFMHNNKKATLLVSATIIIAFIFSVKISSMFYVFSSILMVFIMLHFISEYTERRNPRLILMTLAFAFLAIGTFELLFSGANYIHCILGHLLTLLAYGLIITNLVKTLQHGKKKNKA